MLLNERTAIHKAGADKTRTLARIFLLVASDDKRGQCYRYIFVTYIGILKIPHLRTSGTSKTTAKKVRREITEPAMTAASSLTEIADRSRNGDNGSIEGYSSVSIP